jgi:Sulfotransferase family
MSLYRELCERIREGEFNYAFSLSLKNKYVYVENAKAACTTLKSILGEWEFAGCELGSEIPQLFLGNVHVNVIGTPFVKPFQLGEALFDELLQSDAYFRFSFVRSPYTRLLSAYLDKIVGEKPEGEQIVAEAKRLELAPVEGGLSFVTFLKCVGALAARGAFLDKHWRPQHHQLYPERIRYDLIGKVENLQKDVESVAAALGMNAKETQRTFGHETRAAEQVERYYDDEARALVARIYKADFETFGYDTAP